MLLRLTAAAVLVLALLSAPPVRAQEEDADPPEVAIGERLFLETRFAQYFAAHSGGDVNRPLATGDPAVDATLTIGAPLPGPFAGQSMNCRSCHLVDEHHDAAGNRTYGDFARRSPIPDRGDGHTTTPRNSPPLVGASLARKGFFLHFDAEFPSDLALVKGTFTGRNFGWLPNEHDQAVAQIAKVLREDNGSGALAQEFGGSYPVVLAGTDPSIPPDFRLPRRFRIDVTRASDAELLEAAATLVSVYVKQLTFAADERGRHNASPYDLFLEKNFLPTKPHSDESAAAYTRRLTKVLGRLRDPKYVVDSTDGAFVDHAQPFVFGSTELAGMRLFFGAANCTACHPAPDFTDFGFHNTGLAEVEYDAIHGAGAFAALAIPDRATRDADPAAYLPPSAAHPSALGRFRAIPTLGNPDLTDLGLWNIYANADVVARKQQKQLDRAVCRSREQKARSCAGGAALADTIGLFKTPGLRDLGDSAPYLHTGEKDTIEDVLAFYVDVSARARSGTLRNADPRLTRMTLGSGDIPALAAFLRALDEDYE